MRVKQRTVCQTCRTRKLGCDGKRPECGQCILRGRQCQWDATVWAFVPQNARVPDGRNVTRRQLNKKPFYLHGTTPTSDRQDTTSIPLLCAKLAPYPPLSLDGIDCRYRIESIIDAYIPQEELSCVYLDSDDMPRVCGAWVGVLPKLAETARFNRILSVAIRALSSCISSTADAEDTAYLDSVHAYNTAVVALRTNIQTARHRFNDEFVAAVMCLTLAELMFPDSRFGVAMHINCVAQFFQASGPERFKSGILQSLFAGFRPVLMLQAFQSRTPTFIASKKWVEIPFSICRPSLMQCLITETATLPSLLQETDKLLVSPDANRIQRLYNAYLKILSRLESWEASFCDSSSSRFWSCPTPKSRTPAPTGLCLWFPNITMANVYTHLWAFRIICVSELSRLVSQFPSIIGRFDSGMSSSFFPENPQEYLQALSAQICCSMAYLMQDDLRLFGPMSAMLPLQTAYKVFTGDKNRYIQHIAYIKNIVDSLVVEKGIRSAPYIICA